MSELHKGTVKGMVFDEHGPAAPDSLPSSGGGSVDGPWQGLDRMVPRNQEERHMDPGYRVARSDKKSGPDGVVKTRRYLPGLSDLIDRLSISQLKAIFIPEHADVYRAEIADLKHDINIELNSRALDAEGIHAILLIMLTNRFIWENESKARAGGPDQDKLLKLTHSVNGIRNQAKNVLAAAIGGRRDYKTDCLAADLPPEFGNWDVFK